MIRILAIAALTLRGALRSRVLLALLVLLAVAVLGIPLTVQGDGTPGGRVQILLSYTLGFAGFMASAAALWSGCGAISAEIEDRQLHLVMTKPVQALELWMGKWLGLLALNALLVGFSGAVTYGLLRWSTRPAAHTQADAARLRDEILVARAVARAAVPDVQAAARQDLEGLRRDGRLPAGADPAQVLDQLVRARQYEACAVGPGLRRVRHFHLGFPPGPDRPVYLQFKVSKSTMDMEDLPLRWSAGPDEDRLLPAAEGRYKSDTPVTIPVPSAAFTPDGRLVLVCENLDPARTAFFHPEEGLELLAFRGTFAGNFLRALAVLFCRLAFLSALGLAAGAVFSFPVAAFVSISVLLITAMSGYASQESVMGMMPSMAAGSTSPGGTFLRYLLLGLSRLTAPLQVSGTLDRLATGRLVSWGYTASAFLSHVVISSGALALLSSALFRRRELAVGQ